MVKSAAWILGDKVNHSAVIKYFTYRSYWNLSWSKGKEIPLPSILEDF